VTGPLEGTWSMSGVTVGLKLTAIGGMRIESMKSMLANQPNGAEATKFIDNMQFKVDRTA